MTLGALLELAIARKMTELELRQCAGQCTPGATPASGVGGVGPE
jgi:hypothetical protein